MTSHLSNSSVSSLVRGVCRSGKGVCGGVWGGGGYPWTMTNTNKPPKRTGQSRLVFTQTSCGPNKAWPMFKYRTTVPSWPDLVAWPA